MAADSPGRRHEVLGLVAAAAAVLFGLALASYDARSTENLAGPVGAALAGTVVAAFGITAWLLPFELAAASVRLFRGRGAILGVATVVSTLVLTLVGCSLLHLALEGTEVHGGHLPGGLLGEVLGEVLRSLFGTAGAYVLTITILLITLVLRTRLTITGMVARVRVHGAVVVDKVRDSLGAVAEAWREARELERQEREALEAELAGEELDDDEEEDDEPEASADEEEEDEEPEPVVVPSKPKAPAKKKKVAVKKIPAKSESSDGPKIIAPKETREAPTGIKMPKPTDGNFDLPPVDLLAPVDPGRIEVDAEQLKENAHRLVEKLADYKVKGRVDEIHPGPVVTMYEFEPQSGTKISKIANLENDLALALAAQKVRIVAPIPGKARVGIELPNDNRQTVFLREILEDRRWEEMKGDLPMALGKDIAGQPVYADLAKMPHLLVAGATGAGKSVGLNVMLASILAKKTPEEVRMLMIDPKMVELRVFDGIPHMLLPVVTDMQKAALALKWAVDEMERRYQLFADAGARSIGTYNKRVDKVIAGELPIEKLMPSKAGKMHGKDHEGNDVYADPTDGESASEPPTPEKLPYVVVVVDEFADLMMVAAKDVEAAIARLAQKARAAGIHLILATQRPSVDVITGMIKANFPTRIAFKVSQREDSKTILGRVGAQNLLGRGDMLMLPPGSSDLQRVHCAYISEEEVADICDFLREQGKPVYDENILKPREESSGSGASEDDPIYDRAVACVAPSRLLLDQPRPKAAEHRLQQGRQARRQDGGGGRRRPRGLEGRRPPRSADQPDLSTRRFEHRRRSWRPMGSMRALPIVFALLLVPTLAFAQEAPSPEEARDRASHTIDCLERVNTDLETTMRLLRDARRQTQSSNAQARSDAAQMVVSLQQRVADLARALKDCVPEEAHLTPRTVVQEPTGAEASVRESGDIPSVEQDAPLGRNVRVIVGQRVDGTGTIDDAVVKRTVRTASDRLDRCYAQLVDRGALTTGEARVVFTIRGRGRVRNVELEESSIDNRRFQRCVERATRRMRAASGPSGGETRFSYRLRFGPGS